MSTILVQNTSVRRRPIYRDDSHEKILPLVGRQEVLKNRIRKNHEHGRSPPRSTAISKLSIRLDVYLGGGGVGWTILHVSGHVQDSLWHGWRLEVGWYYFIPKYSLERKLVFSLTQFTYHTGLTVEGVSSQKADWKNPHPLMVKIQFS